MAVGLAPGASLAEHPSGPTSVRIPVVPPGQEQVALELLGDIGFNRPLAGGYTFSAVRIEKSRVVYELHVTARSQDPAVGRVTVAADEEQGAGSAPFAVIVRIEQDGADPTAAALLEQAAASIRRRDPGRLYATAVAKPGWSTNETWLGARLGAVEATPVEGSAATLRRLWRAHAVAVLGVLITALVLLARRGRAPGVDSPQRREEAQRHGERRDGRQGDEEGVA